LELRRPAVPAAVALAAAIVVDRVLSLDGRMWLGGGVVSLLAWWVCHRRGWNAGATAGLLAACAEARGITSFGRCGCRTMSRASPSTSRGPRG
jgi:hypothetical protein